MNRQEQEMKLQAELAVDAKATLGEGPVWDDQRSCLFWVDIEEGKLHAFEPSGEPDRVFDVGCKLGAAVPRASGGMVLATENGFETFDLDTNERTLLAEPESHLPYNRFNDGKCDVEGRFWAGTMSMIGKRQAGALYVLDRDHSVRRIRSEISISNGLDWSLDQSTMYYIDTPTRQVLAFDYDAAKGTVENERVAIQFAGGVGVPDGMTVDAEGMLWIAHWEGGCVTRWDPDSGTQLATILLPAERVTSCTFGDANLDALYITTARQGLDPSALARQPTAGGIFAAKPGVHGLPARKYAG
jgi:sugar lactone lactonase YvrE